MPLSLAILGTLYILMIRNVLLGRNERRKIQKNVVSFNFVRPRFAYEINVRIG